MIACELHYLLFTTHINNQSGQSRGIGLYLRICAIVRSDMGAGGCVRLFINKQVFYHYEGFLLAIDAPPLKKCNQLSRC